MANEPTERELVLVQGSEKPFDIFLFDEHDNPDDLKLVTDATFVVMKDVNDNPANAVINISTTTGELTVDKTLSKLTGQLTPVQAQGLEVGKFIGQAGVFSDGEWYFTDPFNVRIRKTFGVTT